jgi:hypothetical protein
MSTLPVYGPSNHDLVSHSFGLPLPVQLRRHILHLELGCFWLQSHVPPEWLYFQVTASKGRYLPILQRYRAIFWGDRHISQARERQSCIGKDNKSG